MQGRVTILCVLLAAGCGKKQEKPSSYAETQAHETAATSVSPEPLAIDGQPLDGSMRPRAAAGAITGEDDRARAAFAITAPGTGWRFAWDDLSVLAVPDRSWMARRCDGREVDPKAGDLTAALVAAAAGPFVDHDQCVSVLPPGEDFPRPLAALGAGDERSIILVRETMDPANQTLYDIASSTDGGKSWTLKSGPPDVRTHSVADVHADRVAGTVDVLLRAHHEDGEVMLLLQADGAHPLDIPEPVEVERFLLESACRSAGNTWWLGDDHKVRRARHSVVTEMPGEVPGEIGDGAVIDCNADQALVQTASETMRCGADGCTRAFTGTGRAALLGNGRAVQVVADGNVLKVSREGTPDTASFTLPSAMQLEGVVVWSDVPYAVLAQSPDAPPELVSLK